MSSNPRTDKTPYPPDLASALVRAQGRVLSGRVPSGYPEHWHANNRDWQTVLASLPALQEDFTTAWRALHVEDKRTQGVAKFEEACHVLWGWPPLRTPSDAVTTLRSVVNFHQLRCLLGAPNANAGQACEFDLGRGLHRYLASCSGRKRDSIYWRHTPHGPPMERPLAGRFDHAFVLCAGNKRLALVTEPYVSGPEARLRCANEMHRVAHEAKVAMRILTPERSIHLPDHGDIMPVVFALSNEAFRALDRADGVVS